MKINIIAVGKLKFEYRESFNSFVKKITPFLFNKYYWNKRI